MLTSNIDINDRLINGQFGYVFDFANVNKRITKIYVKLDDSLAGIKAMCKDKFSLRHKVIPIELIEASFKISSKSPYPIQRTQFPIMLAWGCTIHKVQGLTIENLVLSLQLNKQKKINNGQFYVALSRATSLDSLHIIGDIIPSHINAASDCLHEYQRLRNENKFDRKIEKSFLSLLNIRGITSNLLNLQHDKKLTNSLILCFTETQISNSTQLHHIVDAFPSFLPLFNINENKYKSLAILYKDSCICLESQQFNGALYAQFSTNLFLNRFSILLLYREKTFDKQQFIDFATYIIQSKNIDIVLGDFNEDFIDKKDISTALQKQNFVQIVNFPTHIRGNIIDHVYVKNCLAASIVSSVHSVYYSDHDAILLHLKDTEV